MAEPRWPMNTAIEARDVFVAQVGPHDLYKYKFGREGEWIGFLLIKSPYAEEAQNFLLSEDDIRTLRNVVHPDWYDVLISICRMEKSYG